MLFNSIITIIEGVDVFLNIISDCSRYVKVFELLVYLGTRAYIAVLLGVLYACNLLLLEGLFCLRAAAVYRVSIEFLFKSSQYFKRG